MRLKNPLDIAAQNFGTEGNLAPVLIPTLSKDMVKQLKLAHKEVDVANRPYRKI